MFSFVNPSITLKLRKTKNSLVSSRTVRYGLVDARGHSRDTHGNLHDFPVRVDIAVWLGHKG